MKRFIFALFFALFAISASATSENLENVILPSDKEIVQLDSVPQVQPQVQLFYRDQISEGGIVVHLKKGSYYNSFQNMDGDIYIEMSRTPNALNVTPEVPSSIANLGQGRVKMIADVTFVVMEGAKAVAGIHSGNDHWNFFRIGKAVPQ